MHDSTLIPIDLPKLPSRPLPKPANIPFLPSFSIPPHRRHKDRDPMPSMQRYKT